MTIASHRSGKDPSALATMRDAAEEAARLLKAMSNEHRLLILCHLVGREMTVSELVEAIGLSQSALSQHLAKLRHHRLVRTRRQAQNIYYRLASPAVERLLETLYDLYCAPRLCGPAAEAARTEGTGQLVEAS